jgi:hypothetical protein
LFERAIAILKAGLGDQHPWIATPTNNLGRVIFELGDPAEARVLAEVALANMRIAYPDGHISMARPLLLIADIELASGRTQEAITSITEASTLCAAVPYSNTDRLSVLLTHADCLVAVDRRNEAEKLLVSATVDLDSTIAPDDKRRQRVDKRLTALREHSSD